jgi:photosystem II stability/assembly factor-like uncharacterized protein
VSKITEYTTTNITQTYKVPILLILSNIDTFNISNFGRNWTDVTTAVLGQKKWLAVSISATGQYQCAVNTDGDIYISNRYGNIGTWEWNYNIGQIDKLNPYGNPAISNCVAISATGQYITASNGSTIYVSSNFGKAGSWSSRQAMEPNQIYVSISLNGQYHQVISNGDTIYSSTDYGITWTHISDIENGIYNSIQSFQYSGISVSYNGKYQTIACEKIYISSNYGNTWREGNIGGDTDGVSNRNWSGVSISSTGQYQSAVDSGGLLYISNDYGNNWTNIYDDVNYKNWTSIAVSANGKYQTAVNGDNGSIYFSTSYGNSWMITSSPVVQSKNFQAVSISANAQYQTVIVYGGAIYTSNLI